MSPVVCRTVCRIVCVRIGGGRLSFDSGAVLLVVIGGGLGVAVLVERL